MYQLLGICLVLASFFALNVFVSLAASGIWRMIEPASRRWSARARAEILFALRISAPLLALLFVAVLLVPAYIGYEPHATSEVVSKKLAALAALSIGGLCFAVWRACRAWMTTKKLERAWRGAATAINLPGVDIPTFRIRHAFPIIAVIGTWRPHLFIADQVLESLSQDEIAAAIAHEWGHLAAADNLRRALIHACRDVLMIVPCGRALDRAWFESVECAADEHAAQLSPDVALNLASALVTIARMVPAGGRTQIPLAAFLVGDETRGIKARVRRLLEIASSNRLHSRTRFQSASAISLVVLFAMLIAIASLGGNSQVLRGVHSIVERVVSLLS